MFNINPQEISFEAEHEIVVTPEEVNEFAKTIPNGISTQMER